MSTTPWALAGFERMSGRRYAPFEYCGTVKVNGKVIWRCNHVHKQAMAGKGSARFCAMQSLLAARATS